jgi:xanthosine utilization system XapX-like protein
MCYLKNKSKPSPFSLYNFFLATFVFALLSMESHATGLQKAKGILEIIKSEILSIVPVIAIIALIGLGIGYALNSVQKETFMRWAVGLIIVGSAAQITSMLIG